MKKMKDVYINAVSAFLPNTVVSNEEMEDYIGMIGGKPSRVRSIVLRQNGIKGRYYGLDKNHKITHSNARLAKEAICELFASGKIDDDVTLLMCHQKLVQILNIIYGVVYMEHFYVHVSLFL